MKKANRTISVIIIVCSILALVLPIFSVRADSCTEDVFRSRAALKNRFQDLCDAYPQVTDVYNLTAEGGYQDGEYHDLMMYAFGNPTGGRVLVTGAIHGFEDFGSEAMYYFAKWLVETQNSTTNTLLITNYFMFIPTLQNEENNVMDTNCYLHRKNNNVTGFTETPQHPWEEGVDLNRNFPEGWDYAGSSDCRSDYYKGGNAASEAVTKTMLIVFENFKPDVYLDLHYCGGAGFAYACSSSFLADFSNSYQNYIGSGYDYLVQNVGYDINGMAIYTAKEMCNIDSLLIEIGKGHWTDYEGYHYGSGPDEIALEEHQDILAHTKPELSELEDISKVNLFPIFRAAADQCATPNYIFGVDNTTIVNGFYSRVKFFNMEWDFDDTYQDTEYWVSILCASEYAEVLDTPYKIELRLRAACINTNWHYYLEELATDNTDLKVLRSEELEITWGDWVCLNLVKQDTDTWRAYYRIGTSGDYTQFGDDYVFSSSWTADYEGVDIGVTHAALTDELACAVSNCTEYKDPITDDWVAWTYNNTPTRFYTPLDTNLFLYDDQTFTNGYWWWQCETS